MMAKFAREPVEIIELTDAERAAFVAALKPVLDKHRKEFDPRFFAMFASG